MNRILIGSLMAFIAASSYSFAGSTSSDIYKSFLDAATLCPAPNNPIENGLKVLHGNKFEITSSGDNGDGRSRFTASVMFQGDGPAVFLGQISLIAGVPVSPGGTQDPMQLTASPGGAGAGSSAYSCELTVKPIGLPPGSDR